MEFHFLVTAEVHQMVTHNYCGLSFNLIGLGSTYNSIYEVASAMFDTFKEACLFWLCGSHLDTDWLVVIWNFLTLLTRRASVVV